MGHPERVMPFCVRGFRVRTGDGRIVAEDADNHQTRRVFPLPEPVIADRLIVELDHPSPSVPAALYGIRVYE